MIDGKLTKPAPDVPRAGFWYKWEKVRLAAPPGGGVGGVAVGGGFGGGSPPGGTGGGKLVLQK